MLIIKCTHYLVFTTFGKQEIGMINLTFQVKKWRCREVKSLVQVHTMNKCQSQDLSFNLTLKHCSFPSIALEVLSQA